MMDGHTVTPMGFDAHHRSATHGYLFSTTDQIQCLAYLRVVSTLAPPFFNPFSKKDWKESRALSSEDPSLGFTLSANAFTMVSAPTNSNIPQWSWRRKDRSLSSESIIYVTVIYQLSSPTLRAIFNNRLLANDPSISYRRVQSSRNTMNSNKEIISSTTYTYIYIYTIHSYTHAYTHIPTHIYTHIYIHTYTYTLIHPPCLISPSSPQAWRCRGPWRPSAFPSPMTGPSTDPRSIPSPWWVRSTSSGHPDPPATAVWCRWVNKVKHKIKRLKLNQSSSYQLKFVLTSYHRSQWWMNHSYGEWKAPV